VHAQDRRPITAQNLLEPALPDILTQLPPTDDDAEDGIRAGSSAKIDQLVHLLKLTPSMEKSLVFSQFTSFLDKVCSFFDPRDHTLT
jgi:SWI/SNF-related matrix-associated actin-dependent regulator of chromatin subfamily A3